MDLNYCMSRMSANVDTFVSLTKGVGDDQARWRPEEGKWSMLEVIGHLYDEEQYDFRPRIDITLHHPDEQWPPFDPQIRMKEQRYNDGILEETLQTWIDERRRSIEWLHALSSPDWNRSYKHPTIGELRAGDLLAAWLAHDLLHVRQLASLHVAYAARVSSPFHIAYASP